MLECETVILRVRCIAPPRAPVFPGPSLRGAFGHALTAHGCIAHPCGGKPCALPDTCAVGYMFSTRLPEGAAMMRRYDDIPHPMVLVVPRVVSLSDKFTVGVTLFGRARAHRALIHRSLEDAVSNRWRLAGSRCTVVQAESDTLKPLAREPDLIDGPLVRVRLETPLRLKGEGANSVLKAFDTRRWFSSITRRISTIRQFHMGIGTEGDFRALASLASASEVVTSDVTWLEVESHSMRQETLRRLGGMIGSVVIRLAEPARMLPWILAGQACNAGSLTSMGYGRFAVEAITSASLHTETMRSTPANVGGSQMTARLPKK
jgi:CRISPR-associated endoribonuclease Cas6